MSISYWLVGAGALFLTILFVGGWNRFMKFRRAQLGDTNPTLTRPPSRAK